jgi:dTDP-N-acetylfucosamine:lipid II N-acetylfucosaminyltransferase
LRFILKKAKVHLTHIETDSDLANEKLQSKALFHYSPVYLSNVVSTYDFNPTIVKDKVKIMVGNSTSLNNDHISILNKLKKFEESIEYIICPLSYGMYADYKESIKVEGYKLFGSKFKPVEEFMSMEKYIDLLKDIDIAVFNHWRQEAMGVTLTLLSLGKIVYVNPITTSFGSLTKRGFKIYDNNLLFNEGVTVQRNVIENKKLLEKYYSLDVLLETLKKLQINKQS